ncbi:MAG: hypothetical protein HY741_24815 [Chloroflexi bacterium]|nr:hypothetical protein [Chloroflexota bacterium]
MSRKFMERTRQLFSWYTLLGIAVLLAIGIGAMWIGTDLLSANREDSSSSPPQQTVPDYMLTDPLLAGKVITWTESKYSFLKNGADPANGQSVRVESWVKVGSDGIPTRAHILSLFEDGAFHQEILVSPDATTIIFGSNYPDVSSGAKTGCRQNWPAYSPEMRKSLLPSFIDEKKLSRFGFAPADLPTPNYPKSSSLVNANPEKTLESGKTVRGWQMRQTSDGITNIEKVLIGERGRVLALETNRTDNTGQVIAENKSVFSSIRIYMTKTIPEKVFSLSDQAHEVCHE